MTSTCASWETPAQPRASSSSKTQIVTVQVFLQCNLVVLDKNIGYFSDILAVKLKVSLLFISEIWEVFKVAVMQEDGTADLEEYAEGMKSYFGTCVENIVPPTKRQVLTYADPLNWSITATPLTPGTCDQNSNEVL